MQLCPPVHFLLQAKCFLVMNYMGNFRPLGIRCNRKIRHIHTAYTYYMYSHVCPPDGFCIAPDTIAYAKVSGADRDCIAGTIASDTGHTLTVNDGWKELATVGILSKTSVRTWCIPTYAFNKSGKIWTHLVIEVARALESKETNTPAARSCVLSVA